MTPNRPPIKVPNPDRLTEDELKATIYEESEWEVFIQPDCPWSKRALELLERNNQDKVEVIDVIDRKLIQSCFRQGWATTPIIYRNKVALGGYSELTWYFQRTLLDPKKIKFGE